MSVNNIFVSLVIAATLLSYILCFMINKPVNEKVDYIIFYTIIIVSIVTKGFIFKHQRAIGKDNDIDLGINMFGVGMEALGLGQDILFSRWLLAKLVKSIKDQSLGEVRVPFSKSIVRRV